MSSELPSDLPPTPEAPLVYPPPGPYPDIGDHHGHTDPDGNPLPTAAELLAGKTREGLIPKLYSRLLYKRWDAIVPGDVPADTPGRAEYMRLREDIDLEAIDLLGLAANFHRRMIETGNAVLDGNAPEGIKPEVILRLAQSSARAMKDVVLARRDLLREAASSCLENDLRAAFMEDRAHAVVHATLLALDEKFQEVGFGSWMPFRFPDQWLMFCGVLRRVLAANGLIHSQDPDVYRRLLEETPPVEGDDDEGPHGPRKMPRNWSKVWNNRGSPSMEDLRQRLDTEVWSNQPRQKGRGSATSPGRKAEGNQGKATNKSPAWKRGQ